MLVLHGLEGCIRSHYASGLMALLEQQGYRPVFMHFRGCSGHVNRLPRAYHSGDTGDLAAVIDHLGRVSGQTVYAAVGFSLGGNVLLKWLAETGSDNPLSRAIAISVPFNLADATQRLEQGFSRLYRNYLLRKLHATYLRKQAANNLPIHVDVSQLTSFRNYDNLVTAPLHGFADASDYYKKSSCRQFLKDIKTPTQIIHSLDDPFMFPHSVPTRAELSDSIEFLLCEAGGHLGFVCGRLPWRSRYWHEQKIGEFLAR